MILHGATDTKYSFYYITKYILQGKSDVSFNKIIMNKENSLSLNIFYTNMFTLRLLNSFFYKECNNEKIICIFADNLKNFRYLWTACQNNW